MRIALFTLLVLATPLGAVGSVRTVVVTKDNQQKTGVAFSLTTEKHPDRTPDSVFIEVGFVKKGKLQELDEVLVQVREGDALKLRVPLSLKQDHDAWVGSFQMAPALAKRCVICLVCHTPGTTAVTTYEVQVATYLGK